MYGSTLQGTAESPEVKDLDRIWLQTPRGDFGCEVYQRAGVDLVRLTTMKALFVGAPHG